MKFPQPRLKGIFSALKNKKPAYVPPVTFWLCARCCQKIMHREALTLARAMAFCRMGQVFYFVEK